MKMIFDLDLEKCVACGACAIACMDQNDIFPAAGDVPLRRVETAEPGLRGEGFVYLSIACLHCTDAPCVSACPSGHLEKNEQGLTVFSEEPCTSCRKCAAVCPFGVPRFGGDGKMSKCTGCALRLEHGLEPACVRICPTDALICLPKDEYKAKKPKKSLRNSVK